MFTLKKDPNKDFTVLNLTDPQLKTERWADSDFRGHLLVHTVNTLVERVKPDLITVSGDISAAAEYEAYENFADLMESFDIPWAPIWGNHDHQLGQEPVEKVVESYLTKPHCLYEKGDPSMGNGNYVIEISQNGTPIHGIIMIDSHNRKHIFNADGERINKYDKLWQSQLDWYGDVCSSLKERGCNETTIILHIPFYAYNYAFKAAFLKGINPKEVKVEESYSHIFWNEGYKDSFGVKYEGVGCYYQDDFVLEEILKHGSTKTVIAGHDHINNWVVKYKGVRLAYGLKTGAGCYWRPQLNGGTVLTIDGSGTVSLRHEYVSPDKFIG